MARALPPTRPPVHWLVRETRRRAATAASRGHALSARRREAALSVALRVRGQWGGLTAPGKGVPPHFLPELWDGTMWWSGSCGRGSPRC